MVVRGAWWTASHTSDGMGHHQGIGGGVQTDECGLERVAGADDGRIAKRDGSPAHRARLAGVAELRTRHQDGMTPPIASGGNGISAIAAVNWNHLMLSLALPRDSAGEFWLYPHRHEETSEPLPHQLRP